MQEAIRQFEEEWFLKAEPDPTYKKGFEIGLKEAWDSMEAKRVSPKIKHQRVEIEKNLVVS
jgi:hypothetical protein